MVSISHFPWAKTRVYRLVNNGYVCLLSTCYWRDKSIIVFSLLNARLPIYPIYKFNIMIIKNMPGEVYFKAMYLKNLA